MPERIQALTAKGLSADGAQGRTQELLTDLGLASRAEFGGRVSYASGIWEDPDWSAFDIVGVNSYRDGDNAHYYAEMIKREHRHGKPVAITEFGCCTYVGAGARGGLGWMVGDIGMDPRFDGSLQRDEQEQVRYLRESLAAFDRAGIDSAFWYTFGTYVAPHRDDPRRDEDLASYSVVAAHRERLRQRPIRTCRGNRNASSRPSRRRTDPPDEHAGLASLTRGSGSPGDATLSSMSAPVDRRSLIFDADDTLWENNVLFERVVEDYLDWLAHPTLDRTAIRAILDEIEAANAKNNGYGARAFLRNLGETFERLHQRPVSQAEQTRDRDPGRRPCCVTTSS